MILPALTLSAFSLARVARLTRSSMLEVLGQDYIRTARAKGLLDRVVLLRHGLRNASVSILTVVGLSLSQLIGGTVVTETIFSWPGLGRLLIQAVGNRDYALVQATVLVIAVGFVVGNLITDLLLVSADPRIRFT